MRRCLCCRATIPKGTVGRPRSYCSLKCQQTTKRLNKLCKHSSKVLPDLLLLPLGQWQRAMWQTMRENEGA